MPSLPTILCNRRKPNGHKIVSRKAKNLNFIYLFPLERNIHVSVMRKKVYIFHVTCSASSCVLYFLFWTIKQIFGYTNLLHIQKRKTLRSSVNNVRLILFSKICRHRKRFIHEMLPFLQPIIIGMHSKLHGSEK